MNSDFAAFVDASLNKLLGFGYMLTGNKHDAWDLTQEALVRVGRGWGTRAPETPLAYTKTTMVRLNLARLRRLRREAPFSHQRIEPPAHEAADLPEWVGPALMGLTPKQRTVVALRFVEDLDLAAIAERLGCSVGTVKSHLSRAMTQLREHAPAPTQVSETRSAP